MSYVTVVLLVTINSNFFTISRFFSKNIFLSLVSGSVWYKVTKRKFTHGSKLPKTAIRSHSNVRNSIIIHFGQSYCYYCLLDAVNGRVENNLALISTSSWPGSVWLPDLFYEICHQVAKWPIIAIRLSGMFVLVPLIQFGTVHWCVI